MGSAKGSRETLQFLGVAAEACHQTQEAEMGGVKVPQQPQEDPVTKRDVAKNSWVKFPVSPPNKGLSVKT